ncbi:MAG TPA: ABC transporter permease [Rhodanobacteraceae bacterium]|nr:ABC transporter permease [Rhodanobacteraceae bacterium]
MEETSSDASWKLAGETEVCLSGSWSLLLDTRRRRRLSHELNELDSPRKYRWDLRRVETLDSAGALLLWTIWDRKLPEQLDCPDDHRHWFRRLEATDFSSKPSQRRRRPRDALDRIGDGVMAFAGRVGGMALLIGQLMLDVAYCVAHPRVIPWKEISATIYNVGATSMLLLGCVGFLIGVVMTIQVGMALQQFAAGMMVIHMMGLAVLRELGPVICGLILTGRSGSAMTAGIGAMHITGEYDALKAFGSSPSLRLALPRVIGATISVPLLVVWTDFFALIGSAMTAQFDLGIGYKLFLARLPEQVQIVNFWIGLGKGALFGMTIALVGCYFGMSASPDSDSLSRNTTLSVVTSLTLMLLFDAGMGALLTNVGLL